MAQRTHQRKRPSKRAKGGRYDAIVVLGKVSDQGSVLPGWNYPFSQAVEDWSKRLQASGYANVGVFREPGAPRLRALLAGKGLRAVVFVGHGQYEKKHYSFQLNDKENISGQELRGWAKEDVVVSRHLSEAAVAKLAENPVADDALRRVSSYNFDLAVVHSCHSMRSPELRGALGGHFEGNLFYSLVKLPPLFAYTNHTLAVDSESFAKDPVGALQGALMRSLHRLDHSGSSLVPPDYERRLRETLAAVLALRRKGKLVLSKVIDEVRRGFSVEFGTDGDGFDDTTVDEALTFLKQSGHQSAVEATDCGIPTRQSNGELPCRRRVMGGGPCWQHDRWINP